MIVAALAVAFAALAAGHAAAQDASDGGNATDANATTDDDGAPVPPEATDGDERPVELPTEPQLPPGEQLPPVAGQENVGAPEEAAAPSWPFTLFAVLSALVLSVLGLISVAYLSWRGGGGR